MSNFTTITVTGGMPLPSPKEAWQAMNTSFELLCLRAGVEAIEQMLEDDAKRLCGPPHARSRQRSGHRWGTTEGPIAFHGGKVAVRRPRIRSSEGQEVALPSWSAAQAENWLGRWAMNLMLINVSTRKLSRAVRLPDSALPAAVGDGTSKSAASRRFVALSAERMAQWMAADLSGLDLLVIQIDGLHIGGDIVLLSALGIDAAGHKHPLGLMEGATENAAVVQALLDNLVGRGLDPACKRLFIVDGAKALSKAIRRTYGGAGDDWLEGGEGNDRVETGILDGFLQIDIGFGEAGNDTLFGDQGIDVLFGGDGTDLIVGYESGDWLEGGASADSIYGGDGEDVALAGIGNDTAQGDDGNDYWRTRR